MSLFTVLGLNPNKFAGITIDIIKSEEPTYEAIITKNPVEDGSVTSDNIVLLPTVLEVEGRISDTPIDYLTIGIKGRSNDVFKALVDLQTKKAPFDIEIGENFYINMMFEKLSAPKTSADGYSVRFTAVLSEVLIKGNNAKTIRDNISEDVQHSALAIYSGGFV